MEIKGMAKAVSDFNRWQGVARIYFDKEAVQVNTYVYDTNCEWEKYRGAHIKVIWDKTGMMQYDETITMEELQALCEARLESDDAYELAMYQLHHEKS